MPSRETILLGLTTAANDWGTLAIGWHVLLATFFVAVFAGWRPPARLLGRLLIAPIVSVAALAATSRNPFNGVSFAVLAILLAGSSTRLSRERVQFSPPLLSLSGAALVVFGWTYPHFLKTDSWTAYLYAAPFGLLPCPTLATAIGVTLLFGMFHSKTWSVELAAAGIIYGLIGVGRLGVTLDWGLLAGAVVLVAAVTGAHTAWRSVDGVRGDAARTPRLA